jgi:exodeoxyribonuclease V alpha subunit
MKCPIELSPLGTALAAVANVSSTCKPSSSSPSVPEPEIALLAWLGQVREQLRALYNLEDEVAFIAWDLAHWQPGISLVERQALILLILMIHVHLRLGSTRIAWHSEQGLALRLDLAGKLLKNIKPTTGLDTLVDSVKAIKLMETLIESGRAHVLIGTADEFKPLINTASHLYFQKMLYMEDRFVATMRGRLTAEIPGWSQGRVNGALHDVCSRPMIHAERVINLEVEQQETVKVVVRYPVTVISGGPGTGKTTMIIAILRVLRRLGVTCGEIALAAPTGKAATRIHDAIRTGLAGIADKAELDRDLENLAEPRTLHRLLGYSNRLGRFLYHENNRLAERVIIVDEASMIDLALMERLMRSLRDDSRFILLGDARQLPSIEAGAVLRDLVGDDETEAPNRPWCVRLTQGYRMRHDDEGGRHILSVAQDIDRGATPNFTLRGSVTELKFQGVEFLEAAGDPQVLDEFLKRWYHELVKHSVDLGPLIDHEYALVQEQFSEDDMQRLHLLFNHWRKFCILCVTRVLPTGSDRVNAFLHQHIVDQSMQQQRARSLPERSQDRGYIPGEPVMMQVNDYKRMIFNGDQGFILNVSDRGNSHRMAVFPRSGSFVAFHAKSLWPDLQLSYAITVHKAQGSEFDQVALILPDRDLPICTREIVYTALSRSRMSVVLVGSRDILKAAASRTITRDSGIAEKLRGSLSE